MGKQDNSSSVLTIISGLVSIFAGLFVLFNNWDLGFVAGFLVGITATLIGIFFVVALGIKSLILILFGFYCMGQALGIVDHQYLRYGLGIPLIILGGFIVFRGITSPEPDSSIPGESE